MSSFELRAKETFADWMIDLRRQLRIVDDSDSLYYLGIYLFTVKRWEKNGAYPRLLSLLSMAERLSLHTNETPQDILDTMIESIPHWRKINDKARVLEQR